MGNDYPDKYEYAPGFTCNIWPNIHNIQFTDTIFQILNRFCEYRQLSYKEIMGVRSFIHLPSGVNKKDPIHIDNDFEHYGLLYYVNDSEGDTTFFEDDEVTEIKKVSPKKGRVVFFDGSVKHCSSTPISKTRCIINFNFTTN